MHVSPSKRGVRTRSQFARAWTRPTRCVRVADTRHPPGSVVRLRVTTIRHLSVPSPSSGNACISEGPFVSGLSCLDTTLSFNPVASSICSRVDFKRETATARGDERNSVGRRWVAPQVDANIRECERSTVDVCCSCDTTADHPRGVRSRRLGNRCCSFDVVQKPEVDFVTCSLSHLCSVATSSSLHEFQRSFRTPAVRSTESILCDVPNPEADVVTHPGHVETSFSVVPVSAGLAKETDTCVQSTMRVNDARKKSDVTCVPPNPRYVATSSGVAPVDARRRMILVR